jgi:hypothetical protein
VLAARDSSLLRLMFPFGRKLCVLPRRSIRQRARGSETIAAIATRLRALLARHLSQVTEDAYAKRPRPLFDGDALRTTPFTRIHERALPIRSRNL